MLFFPVEDSLSYIADCGTYSYIRFILNIFFLFNISNMLSPHRTMTKGIKSIFKLAAHYANVLPLCPVGCTLDVK